MNRRSNEFPKVLLVDDDQLVLERLHVLIRTAGFDVEIVNDGVTALDALRADFSPIVIADRNMPGMDGLALCRAIRRNDWPGYVYILLLTAQDAEEDILAGLEAGADDYVSKRASPLQLLARLCSARRILSLERSLTEALEENRLLSLTDPLTGAANRRYFMQELTRELEHAHGSGQPLSLLCLDIDDVKRINDRYGHAAGDKVLQEFVRRVNGCLRPGMDWCARIGGEEFAVVLVDVDVEAARATAEAMRAAAASAPIGTNAGNIPITVSIGVAGWCAGLQAPVTTESLLQRGDEALYASKAAGRNRVTLSRS